jgi:hypothetical protein
MAPIEQSEQQQTSHIVEYLPNNIGQFFADNLKNALLLNVVLVKRYTRSDRERDVHCRPSCSNQYHVATGRAPDNMAFAPTNSPQQRATSISLIRGRCLIARSKMCLALSRLLPA